MQSAHGEDKAGASAYGAACRLPGVGLVVGKLGQRLRICLSGRGATAFAAESVDSEATAFAAGCQVARSKGGDRVCCGVPGGTFEGRRPRLLRRARWHAPIPLSGAVLDSPPWNTILG